MSVGSEATNQQAVDDSSNDALVIVDDSHYPPVTPTSKRGKRGRPKGSTGVPRRSRGRGGVRKSLSAAELAGAQAGMTAATLRTATTLQELHQLPSCLLPLTPPSLERI